MYLQRHKLVVREWFLALLAFHTLKWRHFRLGGLNNYRRVLWTKRSRIFFSWSIFSWSSMDLQNFISLSLAVDQWQWIHFPQIWRIFGASSAHAGTNPTFCCIKQGMVLYSKIYSFWSIPFVNPQMSGWCNNMKRNYHFEALFHFYVAKDGVRTSVLNVRKYCLDPTNQRSFTQIKFKDWDRFKLKTRLDNEAWGACTISRST